MKELSDKTIVITGGSSGIGAAAARALCKKGANVIITGRSEATRKIAEETGAAYYLVDFTRFESVKEFAEKLLAGYPRIDVLVNNVGGIIRERFITSDGMEQTLQVNHLSGFFLTRLLRDRLIESEALVINTSSMANRAGKIHLNDMQSTRGYEPMRAYGTAKLMNILHAMEIPLRYKGVRAASFHPGVVRTRFAREGKGILRWAYETTLNNWFMISPEAGADTLIWLITNDNWMSGGYFNKRRPGRKNSQASPQLAAQLWEKSEELLAAFQ